MRSALDGHADRQPVVLELSKGSHGDPDSILLKKRGQKVLTFVLFGQPSGEG